MKFPHAAACRNSPRLSLWKDPQPAPLRKVEYPSTLYLENSEKNKLKPKLTTKTRRNKRNICNRGAYNIIQNYISLC